MDIAARYRQLGSDCNVCLEKSLANSDDLVKQTKSHNFMQEYELLSKVLDERPERKVLLFALKEYEVALLALLQGHYRFAFSGIRLFFEMMLSVVQFSAHEIDFWLWENGKKDTNWQGIANIETGLFSYNFIAAFSPDLAGEGKHFGAMAGKTYRECSEFVHGNRITHKPLPQKIEFDQVSFDAWHELADTCHLVIMFIFAARFLPSLSKTQRNIVEGIVLDSLGHLAPIRFAFENAEEAHK